MTVGEVKERKWKCPGGDRCVLNFCSLRILIFLRLLWTKQAAIGNYAAWCTINYLMNSDSFCLLFKAISL